MGDDLTILFATVEVLDVLVITGIILALIFDFIKQKIDKLKTQYRIRHTVDIKRHAHWIIQYDMGEPVGAICSNCKNEIGYNRNGYFSETDELYCHNCGCKMDEVTNNDG